MKVELRTWQQQCIKKAIAQYKYNHHFFCQATPGSGKTRTAAELARRLFMENKIDIILCFAPTVQVVEGLRRTFSDILERRLDGTLGSIGDAYTYQAMAYRDSSFWQLLKNYRVFVVFDEIHHCSGHDPVLSNTWGQQILLHIQDHATLSLALSGTPWRSDNKSIALANYSSPDGQLICDFQYGLEEAVKDEVCRSPRLVLIDNQQVKLTEETPAGKKFRNFSSIAELLDQSEATLQDLLRHESALTQILRSGCARLDLIRTNTPDAAGLVVASDVDHAIQIVQILSRLGESCQLVTYRTENGQDVINTFRNSMCRWIVTIGMVSEGTDIPRLQVCCYLSRVRTELYYRQVLGRILRRRGKMDDQAWLFVLAEPLLLEFSRRIDEDLPYDHSIINESKLDLVGDERASLGNHALEMTQTKADKIPSENDDEQYGLAEVIGTYATEKSIEIELSEHYRQEILALFE